MRVCDGKSSGQRSKRSKRKLKDRPSFRPAYRDDALAFGNQIGTRSFGTMMTSQGNIARSLPYGQAELPGCLSGVAAKGAVEKRRCYLPGFRSCDRQKARGATLPQRSRWVSASEQTSISGASRDVEPHSNDLRKRKMTLKLHSRTPSLLQDSTSLPATAEFGIYRL